MNAPTALDTERALTFARSLVGTTRFPQGRCLNFVWSAYGAVSSVGDAVGNLGSAAGAWSVVKKKHLGDRNVPAGYWAYLGRSSTRTDVNNQYGDAILSIGGGLFICTDAVGATIGIMTLAARERQTQRPYVGWAEDLGNHPIRSAADEAARVAAARRAAAAAKARAKKRAAALLLKNRKRDQTLYIQSRATGNIYWGHESGYDQRCDTAREKQLAIAAHGFKPVSLSGDATNEILSARAAGRQAVYKEQAKVLGVQNIQAGLDAIQADLATLVVGEEGEQPEV